VARAAAEGAVGPKVKGADDLLRVDGVEVRYQDVIVALRGASFSVPEGSIVALLGANGAGKTTLLRAVTGLLPVHRGRISAGSITFDGARVDGLEAAAIVRRGVAQVMEGRRIFAELTVDENLRCGGFTVRDKRQFRASYERVMALFPQLADRRSQIAGYFSGGEQQMLAIARALMASPRLLLLDEPSLGLAPMVVGRIRDLIVEINAAGTTVLLVEQNAAMALAIAHHAVVLETGRVAQRGTAGELRADDRIKDLYLGVGVSGRRSYRDVRELRRVAGAEAEAVHVAAATSASSAGGGSSAVPAGDGVAAGEGGAG
jgi:branched-chain amino acid transport system ATP-binding protein